MARWLMKSEPGAFSIEDLARAKGRRTAWDGVRNYQARNFLGAMRAGDEAFFYHSSCPVPAVAGRMRIAREAYPDPSQFDPEDAHYDPRSTRQKPRWLAVDVEFVEAFSEPVTLQRMRSEKALAELLVLRRGNRLSITPVTEEHWRIVLDIAHGRR